MSSLLDDILAAAGQGGRTRLSVNGGALLPSQPTLNVIGGASAVDNPTDKRTDLTIPGASGVAGGQLGGTYPNPDVRGLRETGGPTLLTLGTIGDGQVLQRSGTSIVGVAAGGAAALPKLKFVDASYAGGGSDGSIGKPFTTLGDAVAALGTSSGTIVLVAGDYSSEPDINWQPGAGEKRLVLVCLSGIKGGSGFDMGASNSSAESTALLPGITANQDSSHQVHVTGCGWAAKSVTCAGLLRLDFCQTFGASGTFTANPVIANRCTLGRPLVGGNAGVSLSLCHVLATGTIISTSATLVEALACKFGGTITIAFTGAAGTFRVDSVSNHYWKAATETLTNGSKAIIGDLTA